MKRGLSVRDTKGSLRRGRMGRPQFRVLHIAEVDAVKGALHR